MIALSPEQEASLLKEIKEEAVEKYFNTLIERFGDNLLSVAQAAGYLNVTPQTLRSIDVPYVDITGKGGTLGYDLEDLKAYKKKQKVK